MLRPAVFLDKDGTLVEDVPYNVDPARIRPAPGAPEGLRLLHAAGYLLVVVSNQSGLARGRFAYTDLALVGTCLRALADRAGARLTGFHWCPHHPDGVVPRLSRICACRKPAPGLLLEAARRHRIDLAGSWMVGDILDDVEAGTRAGCRTLLVDRGGETEWRLATARHPDHVASDLAGAARRILSIDQAPDPPRYPWRPLPAAHRGIL